MNMVLTIKDFIFWLTVRASSRTNQLTERVAEGGYMANNETRSKTEFKQIWESYRHLFKDDLTRIAYRRQKMISEMRLFSTQQEYIDEHLENAFEELAGEILRELEPIKKRGVAWT